MSFECKELRDLARRAPCMVEAPVCNHRDDTTVWAHSPYGRHGKAKGMKAHDCFGFFACSACHDFVDRRDARGDAATIERLVRDAMERTQLYLWTQGLIGVARRGEPSSTRVKAKAQATVLPKILPHRHVR